VLHEACSVRLPQAGAREELLVKALYKVMREENFTEAYRMVVGNSTQGDGVGQ